MSPVRGGPGAVPEGDDPDRYDRRRRRVLWQLTTGLYLVGSRHGEEANLMTANLVTQVATEPKLVGVAIEVGSRTRGLIEASRVFSLCLLVRGDSRLVRLFAKPATHDRAARTLSGVPYLDAPGTGSPVPVGAYAYLDCRVVDELASTSHTFCVGEVVAADFLVDETTPVLRSEDTRMHYGG